MPNIMLYGYGTEAAAALRQKIRDAYAGYHEPWEVVTTIVPSDVESLDGDKTAFLRVVASQNELEDVAVRLIPLGEDIEMMSLTKWIPKTGWMPKR